MKGVVGQPMVFLDLETTGGSAFSSRILEIGAIRVEQGRVVSTLHQLLDPGESIPPFISALTGIVTADTYGQPTFEQIAPGLADLMDGAILVAHNVRFDYSFLKMEFGRIGVTFRPQLVCTVQLSRRLFPQFRSHKLEALVERHGLRADRRHRAYDDAHCLWQFYQLCLREFDLDTVEDALKLQLRSQTVPSQLDRVQVEALPEGPGVYIFEGRDGVCLYVGKSVHVRGRVLSHFAADTQVGKEETLARQVATIRGIPTHGELSALLLESRLVKELGPMYNRQLRLRRRLVLVMRGVTADGYATVGLVETGQIDRQDAPHVLGVYTARSRAVQSLRALATNFRLCVRLMGLERTNRECFSYQLGRCDGACVGQEGVAEYNERFEQAFSRQRIMAWPYEGPVMITERTAGMAGSSGVVVDNWCIVATCREADDGSQMMDECDLNFDLDTYKILRQFVQRPSAQRLIRPLGRAVFGMSGSWV